MRDTDLAKLDGVETFNLNKAVRRNLDRFPEDFMFQLTKDESLSLTFQVGMSKPSGRGVRAFFTVSPNSVATFSDSSTQCGRIAAAAVASMAGRFAEHARVPMVGSGHKAALAPARRLTARVPQLPGELPQPEPGI